MDKKIEIKDDKSEWIGTLNEFTIDSKSILIFHVSRTSHELSQGYVQSCRDILDKTLPPNTNYILMGSDVSVYELTQEDLVIQKLKGYG